MTKSAKWTDEDKTTAQVEIQASYTPNQQMDFIFILDNSRSMAAAADDAGYSKMYEMLSKTSDVTDALLKSEDVDSRVAIIGFNTDVTGVKFFRKDTADEVSNMLRTEQWCASETDFNAGLEVALTLIKANQAYAGERELTVIFLSDGEANVNTGKIENTVAEINTLGVPIFGVLYGDSDAGDEYMDIVSDEDKFFQGKDTEGFSKAVNDAIYSAFRSFTLTDTIGEDFEGVTKDDITAPAGEVSVSGDGRTITWDLSSLEPYKTYTLTIDDLKLKASDDGTYKDGSFPTNKDPAPLTPTGGSEAVNEVATPVLKRGSTGDDDGGNGGGGGGTTSKVTLHYESNGGTEYDDERYAKNTVVQFDKFPTREGYQFTGWYADEELTDRITSIKMTSDKTVYAGWRASTVPDMLNGDDHIAYVIGYPDGSVQPQGNVTRAETATIFFRLLKADVRDGNLTAVNSYEDIHDGTRQFLLWRS